jgi:TolA-binding protein
MCLALLLCGAHACWGTDYLYTAQPTPDDAGAGEGVLVREVTIKKGDTLSHLSKQLSGHGYYYPQILLFNEIKNPHRIYPGQVIRVPVSHKAVSQQLQTKSARKKQQHRHQVTMKVTHQPVQSAAAPAVQTTSVAEKNVYNQALVSFQKGDWSAAIKLFDEFIVRYPESSLLPEATLNRAECYLRLSAK